YTRGDYW
nr:immunoglobulin heavy chain junction region [Macaca mulatta]MOW99034.1 immunoglobulin heavy chain junction region [Macaca mulatta]MOW99518.1 immunoglobulin heavy chain junction region [Macaca mulatta]MOW99662.1 immunoglobulin heavy chain junction region [Macaca mulatta]MOX00589.1 immunoglobulin heavy chain junction region [Macaca mulatta]